MKLKKIINKKGQGTILAPLLIVGALFFILFIGVLIAFGSTIINWVMDETVPELKSIGVTGDFNVTQAVEFTIDPVNTVIQNFTWLAVLLYIMALLGVIGLSYIMRDQANNYGIAFFFVLVFILVIGSIFISNIYEEFYQGNDDVGNRLKEHIALSYLIIYSPAIMGLIAFIGGAILFSGGKGFFP